MLLPLPQLLLCWPLPLQCPPFFATSSFKSHQRASGARGPSNAHTDLGLPLLLGLVHPVLLLNLSVQVLLSLLLLCQAHLPMWLSEPSVLVLTNGIWSQWRQRSTLCSTISATMRGSTEIFSAIRRRMVGLLGLPLSLTPMVAHCSRLHLTTISVSCLQNGLERLPLLSVLLAICRSYPYHIPSFSLFSLSLHLHSLLIDIP